MKKGLKVEELNKRQVISLMSFRRKKPVKISKRGDTATECPTCNTPIHFEYSNYCSHCGQKLDWKPFRKIAFIEENIQKEAISKKDNYKGKVFYLI